MGRRREKGGEVYKREEMNHRVSPKSFVKTSGFRGPRGQGFKRSNVPSLEPSNPRILESFFLLFIFFWLWGCSPWEGTLSENILAQVNQEQITLEEFNREFKELISKPGNEAEETDLRNLKEAYLDLMIERKILVQEARRSGITVSREELNQTISEIKKDYPGEEFEEKLNLKGISLNEWEARLEEKLLAEKMIRSVSHYRGKIEEKEVLQYYEAHRPDFQVKPKARARQIIVSDGEDAIQILKQLKKGENFEKLAKKKSLGPEKNNGGDLGYFSQGEKPAEFDQVFSMEVGAISDVIKSPYGYHIFKLEEKVEPREISFVEAKPGILQELSQKKGEEEYQKWLQGAKEKAKIKINHKWIGS
jgi:peptidyl-prolyl cis-trans isomerase C